MANRGGSGKPVSPSVREKWTSLPSYQPDPKVLRANRIVSYFGKQDASAFDMMRTKIVQQAKTNNWRRIAITSPTAKCGKTTTTANLAFSLSRQSDLRTLVIEIDLRRPALAKTIGVKMGHNFWKVMDGTDPAEDHMVCHEGNVIFATNAGQAPNPSELLQSAKARAVLSDLEATYKPDLVLFDTSPLLASDDTIGFLEHVDAALLVAAAETSTMEEVDISESEIAQSTQVLGVVLNKCRYNAGGYGYEYGYY